MSNVYNLTENKIVKDEWMGFNILQATTHPLSNIYDFIFIVEYTLYLIQYILGTFRCPGQDLDLCLTVLSCNVILVADGPILGNSQYIYKIITFLEARASLILGLSVTESVTHSVTHSQLASSQSSQSIKSMKSINQANQANQVNQFNHVNQVNEVNQVNQVNWVNQVNQFFWFF
jgi:hypothetical protein